MAQSAKMDPAASARFAEFARRREQAAVSARLEPFETVADHSEAFPVEAITCEFTSALLDGPFFQSRAGVTSGPLMNLVFVQSRDGNTAASDPAVLGGGDTDKHVIYEGLSRVAADAVMAGVGTAGNGETIFSVWHPRLVALRESLGKPRHPTQVVATLVGALPIETGLLFNVPDIPVIIVSAGRAATELAERTRSRPWIRVVSSGDRPDLRISAGRLRNDLGIGRISVAGGRTLATSLIDEALITDLYLTTSAEEAGRPDTPMYAGATPPSRRLVIRKRAESGVVFEHFVLEPS